MRPILCRALAAVVLLGPGVPLMAASAPDAVTPASQASEAADMFSRLLAAQRTVSTISGRFVQRTVRTDDPEGTGTVYHATFDLKAPDRYNVVYAKPGDDEWRLRLCSNGTTRWQIERMFADEAPDVTERPVKPSANGGGGSGGGGEDIMGRLTSLLRFDAMVLAEDFTIVPEVVDGRFRLTLMPRRPGIAEHVQRIVLDFDQDLRTSAIRYDDPQGNRVQVSIDEARYNVPIPPETFVHSGP